MKDRPLYSGLLPIGRPTVVSLLLIAAGLLNSPVAVRASNDASTTRPLPKELTTADWDSIRAAHEAQQHAIIATDRGYRAPNPSQKWATEFDGAGFVTQPEKGNWRWGLELRSYGFSGHEQMATKAQTTKAEGQRLIYDRGTGLSEWFVNDNNGLEHGFTFAKRMDNYNKAPLQFTFAVLGDLQPVIGSDGNEVQFVDKSGIVAVTYNNLQVFDADGKTLPAHFVAGTGCLIVSVDESTARYPITIDPIAQQAYLKASNTGAGDHFGSWIAISGDTVVVGAPNESSSATGINGNQTSNSAANAGAAYVFVRNGSTWTQQAYLKASNTAAGDFFGVAVAISGDTIVVGAEAEASAATGVNGNQADNSAPSAGAAYVFVRNATTWTQQAYLKASNTDPNDFFGRSVAISGDTIVIGASGESSAATGVNGNQTDNSATNAGAAYVFVRNGTTWTQQAYLKASQVDLAFGFDVAISGDTVLVGEEESTGAAYIFVRNGTTWTQQARLTASNAESGDFFGMAVSISGDTALVGAQYESSAATGIDGNQLDNSAPAAGAAYVFVRNGTNWTQQAYLKGSNTEASDRFGIRVGISGDTAVVGAIGEDSSATGVNGNQSDNSDEAAGAAYVFFRSGSTWTQQAYLKASNTDAFDQFGYSVAISGDTAAIGAWDENSAATGINGNQADNSAAASGAAYVFAGLPATAPIQNISTRAQVLTGSNVLIGGFIIGGTGTKDVLVRGLGPTLGDLGVTGALADPTLDLRDGNQAQIATNDNWQQSSQAAAIQATGKAPPHASEPAILQSGLAPGNYTAILAGKNNTTGVGLVEIYDQSPASTAQLTNISSRGRVGTSTNVMIAGFVTAVAENRVIVRVLGPTLSQFGVSGILSDPVLGLFDANGNAIASNDNWQQSAQATEIQNSGFAPPNAAEPAIISIRPIGNTTAIVSGKNGTTGVALVEVYKLP